MFVSLLKIITIICWMMDFSLVLFYNVPWCMSLCLFNIITVTPGAFVLNSPRLALVQKGLFPSQPSSRRVGEGAHLNDKHTHVRYIL